MENVVMKGKSANLSKLMFAQSKADKGTKVNVCPYGCTLEQIDEKGYCNHLVGFTVPGDDTRMEPLIHRLNNSGEPVNLVVDGEHPVDVPKGAHLERVTVCSRVYTREGRTPKKLKQGA